MSIGDASAYFDHLLVGSYPPDFGNLSGRWSTKPHHHVKVANHGGDSSHWSDLNVYFNCDICFLTSCHFTPQKRCDM